MASSTKTVNFTTGGILSTPLLGITIPDPATRGNGIPGLMAPPLINQDRRYFEWEQPRFTLRQAWNTVYKRQLAASGLKSKCTPFRAVNNSGDILSRKNYSCGGSCQTFQSRPNMRGLKQRFGAIQDHCDGTFVPAAACNVKYVYDSSDYITYKKQSAIAKNYNDLSNGGNSSSASQSAIRAIRRY